MSLKLYRLAVECPRCGLRPPIRKTEHEIAAHKHDPANLILDTLQCQAHQGGRRVCTETIYVRAGHYARAVLVDSVERPEPEFPPPLLSPRQEEVCTLVFQGRSDKAVALALGISVWTVRDYLERAERAIRAADPSLRPASPRDTVQGYFAARADKSLSERGLAA